MTGQNNSIMTRFGQRLEDWELLFYTSLNRAVKVVL
jgi:hypothetical protein